MKITRKGKRGGLDIDYQVNVDSPEEVQKLHEELLKKGLLFTYMTGDLPYETPTKNTILHYIDSDVKLYDFAILFTPQEPKAPKERVSTLDKAYKKAETDPTFKRKLMKVMKLHKVLSAFSKHVKAYGELRHEYKDLFIEFLDKNKLELKAYTYDDIKALDKDILDTLK